MSHLSLHVGIGDPLCGADCVLTCAETCLIGSSDLGLQVADHGHMVRVPGEQPPNGALCHRQVLPQHQGLVVGQGDGEVIKVRARGFGPLPVEFGAVLGDVGHLDLSGWLRWKTGEAECGDKA